MAAKILQDLLNLKAGDIKIGKKTIGYNCPVYFIAEAGVNHNGDIKLALKLIEEAKKCGADAVKFQTFRAEQVCLPTSPTPEYQKKNTGADNQWKLLRPLELEEKYYPVLIKKSKQLKIDFLSTPHGHIKSVEFLKKFQLPAFKIGSGDITNFPLLSFLAKQDKPILLSTGTADLKEIKEAIKVIDKQKGRVVILHCNTNYPTPDKEANVSAVLDLYRNFPDKLVGYSDHTIKTESLITATALGVSIIEAHFTLDKKLPGPDHKASFEPKELKNAIRMVRQTEKIIGKGYKKPTAGELKMAPMIRKSITTTKAIRKGEIFNKKNLTIRRPEIGGIKPKFWNKIAGKKAVRNLMANVQLKKGDWK